MYHEQHVIPFVIELNSDAQGFQPAFDEWREKTVTKVRPAWKFLLDRLDHASIRGDVSIPQGARATVRVESVNSTNSFMQTIPSSLTDRLARYRGAIAKVWKRSLSRSLPTLANWNKSPSGQNEVLRMCPEGRLSSRLRYTDPQLVEPSV